MTATTETGTETPVEDAVEQPVETPVEGAVETPVEQPEDTAETFPRKVVEDLRKENGKYRQRAAQADAYGARLHTALVAATGRLADPSDLPFDAEHLDDDEALTAAIDALLADKPHLASRTPRGDVGQGQRGGASEPFSLLNTLKSMT